MKRQRINISQKHFNATATVIMDLRAKYPEANLALDEIVYELIPFRASLNENFKPELFKKSCGVRK